MIEKKHNGEEMSQLIYDYPSTIQNARGLCKLIVFLSVPLLIVMVIRNEPSQYSSVLNYYMAFAWPLVLIIACLHYIGSWSAIGMTEKGVVIEFIWFKLHVPWEDILDVKHVGSTKFGVRLVTTKENRLTLFHRIYSLYTIGSSKPGFHIHSQINGYSDLIKSIERRDMSVKH